MSRFFVLDHDARFDEADYERISPLILAAKNGHLSVVKLLVERGVDVNQGGPYERDHGFALHHAARNNDHRMVAFLLVKNAEVLPSSSSIFGGYQDINRSAFFYGAIQTFVEKGVTMPTIFPVHKLKDWSSLEMGYFQDHGFDLSMEVNIFAGSYRVVALSLPLYRVMVSYGFDFDILMGQVTAEVTVGDC